MCTPTCRCTYKGGPKIPIGVHLLRHFFHCSKQFLNSWILMSFTASAVFCFTSSPSAKHSSLRTFLSGETKKHRLGWDHVNKGGGEWGHAVFGQKLVNTVQCGLCAPKSPSVKRLNSLKESSKKKNSLKLNTASHSNTYNDTDGFLKHSPGGGNLYYNKGPTFQKIIWVFGESPLAHTYLYIQIYAHT